MAIALQSGPAPTRGGPWRERLATAGTALSSAVTHAPENAAYGLMALAPLGAAFGPVAMGLAMLGSAVACATATTTGSGRLVDDAGAALALLTAGLVAALVPHVAGPDGGTAQKPVGPWPRQYPLPWSRNRRPEFAAAVRPRLR